MMSVATDYMYILSCIFWHCAEGLSIPVFVFPSIADKEEVDLFISQFNFFTRLRRQGHGL